MLQGENEGVWYDNWLVIFGYMDLFSNNLLIRASHRAIDSQLPLKNWIHLPKVASIIVNSTLNPAMRLSSQSASLDKV